MMHLSGSVRPAMSMRCVACIILLSCWLIAPQSACAASSEDAPSALTIKDKRLIDRAFGPGVLGPALPAPMIGDPSCYVALRPITKKFKFVYGARAGKTQTYRLFPTPGPTNHAAWQYLAEEEEVGFIQVQDDGSLVLVGVEDIPEKAVTRYDPPEPFLPKGLRPGDQRRVKMSVRVYESGHLDQVKHKGVLTVTYRYLGAYRLQLPVGTFDAVLTKSTFSGQVGPAKLDDTQYRFFAPHVGLLADIERRYVSAYLIYQSETMVAKVLVDGTQRP